jgi:hypothetical protein
MIKSFVILIILHTNGQRILGFYTKASCQRLGARSRFSAKVRNNQFTKNESTFESSIERLKNLIIFQPLVVHLWFNVALKLGNIWVHSQPTLEILEEIQI